MKNKSDKAFYWPLRTDLCSWQGVTKLCNTLYRRIVFHTPTRRSTSVSAHARIIKRRAIFASNVNSSSFSFNSSTWFSFSFRFRLKHFYSLYNVVRQYQYEINTNNKQQSRGFRKTDKSSYNSSGLYLSDFRWGGQSFDWRLATIAGVEVAKLVPWNSLLN